MPIKGLTKINLRKKAEGILLLDKTIDNEVKLFYATSFIVHVLL
jgi:hypothetical protein